MGPRAGLEVVHKVSPLPGFEPRTLQARSGSLYRLSCRRWGMTLQFVIQGESFAGGPKLLSMCTVEQRGFVVRKYWQTGSFNL